tara:strand:+ start:1311 stop:1502 length:192 start_codon:yes stop_codon:yes gene_type:complete
MVRKALTLIEKGVATIFHCIILLLGGILVKSSIRRPKLTMLFNRIIIIIFVTYRLHEYISYER